MTRSDVISAITRAKRRGAQSVGPWTIWAESFRRREGGSGNHLHATRPGDLYVSGTSAKKVADAIMDHEGLL